MLSALGMRAGSFRVSSGSTRASREARLACQGSVVLTQRRVVCCHDMGIYKFFLSETGELA